MNWVYQEKNNRIYISKTGVQQLLPPTQQTVRTHYDSGTKIILIPLKETHPEQPVVHVKIQKRPQIIQWFVGIVLSVFIQEGVSHLITPTTTPKTFDRNTYHQTVEAPQYAKQDVLQLKDAAKETSNTAKRIVPAKKNALPRRYTHPRV